jgi:NAD-dependent DNA ligase
MNVDLVCTNDTCSAQNFKTIVSFFSTLDIDDMGEGNIQILIDSGYDTIESILKITKQELERLPGFGIRKAEKLYGSINAKLKDIPLNVLQHASNMFSGLGSTKLKKLMKYNSRDNKPTKNEVRLIEGFGDNSADVFVDNFDRFWAFVETIPVTIKTEDTVVVGELTGQKIVFTGFRDAGMESEIVSHGGEIQSSLGKSTTILVVSAKGSGSSKEEKALKNGTKIMDKMEFKCYLDAIG